MSKSKQQTNTKRTNTIETCSFPRFSFFLSFWFFLWGWVYGWWKVWSLSTNGKKFINATEFNSRNKFITKLKVEKELDTGSSPNILNTETFQKLQKDKSLKGFQTKKGNFGNLKFVMQNLYFSVKILNKNPFFLSMCIFIFFNLFPPVWWLFCIFYGWVKWSIKLKRLRCRMVQNNNCNLVWRPHPEVFRLKFAWK